MPRRRPDSSPQRKQGSRQPLLVRRTRSRYIPTLELLEDRTLFSASPLDLAVPLNFNAFQAAQVSHLLASPNEVDFYRVTLQSGDLLDASVRAQAAGSGLVSLLRIVDF